jgi:succinate dehydrogenase / fumarate reductase, membrane anchor subunit
MIRSRKSSNNMTTTPKPVENAWLWLLKVASGVLILVILIIHLIVNHFTAPNGLLSYAEVVAYYQNPIIPIMEGIFLVFVVVHSLVGLRSILLDLKPSRILLSIIDSVLTLFGASAIIYGIWLLLAVVAQFPI